MTSPSPIRSAAEGGSEPSTEVEDEVRVPRASSIGRVVARQETTLIAVILLIAVAATLKDSVFATTSNLIEVVRAAVVYFVMACPITLVIIGGGLDFSVGSLFTLGGVSSAWLMTNNVPWPVAIVLGMTIGAGAGLVNALVIQRLGVPPIITTLGTFFLLAGGVVLVTGGVDIQPLPDGFSAFGNGSLAGIPSVVWYGILVGLLYWVVLQKTRFGYAVRAVGGNRLGATENGINVLRVERWLYVGSGAVAAFAGVIFAARSGVGQVSAGGSTVTLTVISAVLIGGTSLFGGLGTITGTALGAILFAEIDNALAVSSVPAQYGNIIIGVVLIFAVAADHYRRTQVFKVKR